MRLARRAKASRWHNPGSGACARGGRVGLAGSEVGQAGPAAKLVGAHHRFAERRDPRLRPPDAVLVEFVLLGYPVLDSPPLPSAAEADDDDTAS